MDLILVNKKRKKISTISIITTMFLVGFYALSIILFASISFLIPILGAILLLCLLYFFSSLIVMKEYMKIKNEVINISIRKELKASKIINNDNKDYFLLNFYTKDSLTIKSNFEIVFENYNIICNEFEITTKRDFKSVKVCLAGKYLSINIKHNLPTCCFIRSNESETEKYVNYYSQIFEKKDDNFYFENKKKYVCLYNDKVDSSILKILDKINSFHMVLILENKIKIIYTDTTRIFDFKLQKKITESTISYCCECYGKLIKLLNAFKKGAK